MDSSSSGGFFSVTGYLKEMRGFVEGVIKDQDPELLDRLQVRGRRDPVGKKPSIIPEVYCFGMLCGIADSLRGATATYVSAVLFGRHTKHDVILRFVEKHFLIHSTHGLPGQPCNRIIGESFCSRMKRKTMPSRAART